MKNTLAACIAFGLLILPSLLLRAGGSVELSDLQALVKQQPALWKFYTDRLDISPKGGGLRLGAEGIPLRGYRVGPYEFPAKLKGSKGDYDLMIILTTDLYFLDSKGREVTDQKLAVKKEEMLISIGLTPKEHPARDGSFVQE